MFKHMLGYSNEQNLHQQCHLVTLGVQVHILTYWLEYSLHLSRVLSNKNLMSLVHGRYSWQVPYGIWFIQNNIPIQVAKSFIRREKYFLRMILLDNPIICFINAWLFVGSLTLTFIAIFPPENPLVYQLH